MMTSTKKDPVLMGYSVDRADEFLRKAIAGDKGQVRLSRVACIEAC